MSILKKLKLSGQTMPDTQVFRLQAVRFNKFLENARALLDMFDDGREKSDGGYIFDRHYIDTLIDGIVERLGMMVYDATVLVPEIGEALYRQYDRHTLVARGLLQRDIGASKSNDADDHEDPEFQLLADVIAWISQDTPGGDLCLLNFMRRAFHYVIKKMESMEHLNRSGILNAGRAGESNGQIYVLDVWADTEGLFPDSHFLHTTGSIPLQHLLTEVTLDPPPESFPESSPDAGGDPLTWIAAVGEHQLSLTTFSEDIHFRLETRVSGYEQSDFIFVFADAAIRLDTVLPEGFHIENTDFGNLAWNVGASADILGDMLTVIGRRLFNTSEWQNR